MIKTLLDLLEATRIVNPKNKKRLKWMLPCGVDFMHTKGTNTIQYRYHRNLPCVPSAKMGSEVGDGEFFSREEFISELKNLVQHPEHLWKPPCEFVNVLNYMDQEASLVRDENKFGKWKITVNSTTEISFATNHSFLLRIEGRTTIHDHKAFTEDFLSLFPTQNRRRRAILRCSFCHSVTDHFCQDCKTTPYCNLICQKQDRDHSKQCKSYFSKRFKLSLEIYDCFLTQTRMQQLGEEKKKEVKVKVYQVCTRAHNCRPNFEHSGCNEWQVCPPHVTAVIEKNLLFREVFCSYSIDMNEYNLNLKNWLQVNIQTGKQRRIKKETVIQKSPHVELHLGLMDADMEILTLTCHPKLTDEEYSLLLSYIERDKKTFSKWKICWIHKGLNSESLMQYSTHHFLKGMTLEFPNDYENDEIFCFHGSGNKNPIEIMQSADGIDFRFSQHGEMMSKYLGRATYLTNDFNHALVHYGYDVKTDEVSQFLPDESDQIKYKNHKFRAIIGCRFRKGKCFVTPLDSEAKKLKRPPQGYDSVCALEPHSGATYYAAYSNDCIFAHCVYVFGTPTWGDRVEVD